MHDLTQQLASAPTAGAIDDWAITWASDFLFAHNRPHIRVISSRQECAGSERKRFSNHW